MELCQKGSLLAWPKALIFLGFLVPPMLLFANVSFASGDDADNSFTAKDFLQLSDEQKKFWIEGAVDAYGQVAAAKSNDLGKCVLQWYYGDKIAERNSLILASMKKYPDIIPSAIMLALTERACGTFRK